MVRMSDRSGGSSLSREESRRLLNELSIEAARRRRRRHIARWVGSVVPIALLVLVRLSLFPRASQDAFAFRGCGPDLVSERSQPIASLLIETPAIGLIQQAQKARIRADSIQLECATRGDDLAAVRVNTTLIGVGSVATTTWYEDPPFSVGETVGSIIVDGRSLRLRRTSEDGSVILSPQAKGVEAVELERLHSDRLPPPGLTISMATRSKPSASVARYDVVLGETDGTSRHPASEPISRVWDVRSLEDVIAKLSPFGLDPIATLLTGEPSSVEVFQDEAGVTAKTLYDVGDAEVALVQAETAGGSGPVDQDRLVEVRDTAGVISGNAVYWDERGYELAIDARGEDPIPFAEAIRWRPAVL